MSPPWTVKAQSLVIKKGFNGLSNLGLCDFRYGQLLFFLILFGFLVFLLLLVLWH